MSIKFLFTSVIQMFVETWKSLLKFHQGWIVSLGNGVSSVMALSVLISTGFATVTNK